jgi:serine/threonine protein kinase
MALDTGSKLGRYEILSSLGAGGMGEVYRARDTKLGREVAIKLLLDDVSADPERLARFEREARVLASLNHNNIATLYGFEKDGDTSFLVMEVVEGETLADRIARGPIAVHDALPLFLQIAEGLEAAHEKGVIHRDLKPANIKVSDDGASSSNRVKILDFGLAKAIAPEVERGDSAMSMSPTLTLAATQRGEILGTAAYMSPEQASGKPIDKRTDVWAFGVCLYEALTGRRTFQADDAPNVLAAVLRDEVKWADLPANVPAAIRRLLRRCLERDRRRRLQDIGDARIELQDSLAAPEPGEGETTAASNSRRPWLAAVVVFAVAGLILGRLTSPSSEPSATVMHVEANLGEKGSFFVGNNSLDLSQDGRYIAYFVFGSDGPRGIAIQDLQTGQSRVVPQTNGAEMLFFSPDGVWIGFLEGGELRRTRRSGGDTATISDIRDLEPILGATWLDRDRIVFGSRGGLYSVSADGGEPTVLTQAISENGNGHSSPSGSPDGSTVIFATDGAPGVVDVRTGETTMLEGIGAAASPRYVASGHLVYGTFDPGSRLTGGTLKAAPFDLAAKAITGAPVTVVDDLNVGVIFPSASFAVSAKGLLAFVPSRAAPNESRMTWVDREGSRTAAAEDVEVFHYPRVSSDGNRILVAIHTPQSISHDLYLYETKRGTRTRLTSEGDNLFPVWTPDGTRVTFSHTALSRDGLDLYWQPIDTTEGKVRMLEKEGAQIPRAWTPDGKNLLFEHENERDRRDIWMLPLDGEPSPLLSSDFDEHSPAVSADGGWLSFVSNDQGSPNVYVQAFPEGGRTWRVSPDSGTQPQWSRAGCELFYRTDDKTFAVSVDCSTGEPGMPQLLFSGEFRNYQGGANYSVAPSGDRLLMLTPPEGRRPEEDRVNLVLNWFDELERLVPTK